MKYLKYNEFRTINTMDLIEIIARKKIPRKTIMITFDDGWLDNWIFAYPVLKKYGLKAVLFIITGQISESLKRKRYDEGFKGTMPSHSKCKEFVEKGENESVMLSWQELKEMEDAGVIDVQSHTHRHQRYTTEGDLDKNSLGDDLATSKNIIEQRLNKNCVGLCWPWGDYTSEHIDEAKRAGFKALFTTIKGSNRADDGAYEIKRIPVGNIGRFNLHKKISIHSNYLLSKLYLSVFKA
ncbi:polysaccharide deacetylase [Candidatus Magnetoovum chiemensis]|nr:polysaccharide deacetylase [Candidatus Magnetoovum chiemensis]